MIYKFRQDDQDTILEVENITDDAPVGIVELSIITPKGTKSICLYKDDVYKLIGALHLLHKELK
jgi:hypothetical protein